MVHPVGGEFPYGLPSRDGPKSVSKYLRPVTMAQLGSISDPGVPPQLHLEGTHPVHKVDYKYPIASSRGTNQGGQNFCGALPGSTKTSIARGEIQQVDIGSNMEACQNNLLHAPKYHAVPVATLLYMVPDQVDSPGILPPMGGYIRNRHQIPLRL